MKTVQQRRPVIWPWILALLVFAVMTWGLVELAVARMSSADQAKEPVPGAIPAEGDAHRNP